MYLYDTLYHNTVAHKAYCFITAMGNNFSLTLHKYLLDYFKKQIFRPNLLFCQFTITCIKDIVMSNTIPGSGFIKFSAPLWARGQDASLVICRLQDRAQLAT